MKLKVLSLLCLLPNIVFAENNKTTISPSYSYVNIYSNVIDTKIYINKKFIGNSPIEQHKIQAYSDINLTGIANKEYYKNNITKNIRTTKNKVLSYTLKFQKADSKIFLIGEDADLYINGRFIRSLTHSNRIVDVKAKKDLEIKLENKHGDYINFKKDVKANSTNNFQYKLIKYNKDVKLYTSTIDDTMMWQDTKDIVTNAVNWKEANRYCKTLELAGFKDWKLPSLEQLKILYTNKEKIYNGFGTAYYWSSDILVDKKNLWEYSYSKGFEVDETKKFVKEFKKGRVRCIRDVEAIVFDEKFN